VQVLDVDVTSTDLEQLTAADLSGPHTRRRLVKGQSPIGVLLGERDLAAVEQTLSVLATVGAREAIAEGLSDLAAGRADKWVALRTDYGRGDPDEPPRSTGEAAVLVSHRARWDLELLPPEAAAGCFDLLDSLAGQGGSTTESAQLADLGEASLPLVAGFEGLEVARISGFRLVVRSEDSGMQVVHVDAVL
jgi:hypothetical protein